MVPKDKDKLAKYLSDTYSIDIEWTHGKRIEIAPCLNNNFCDEWHWFSGSLELKPDFSVPNPKEDLGKSMDNIRKMPDFFRSEAGFIKVDWFDGDDPQDAVDGAAVPVFMVQQAVQSMKDIYEAGKEIEKKEMEVRTIKMLPIKLLTITDHNRT